MCLIVNYHEVGVLAVTCITLEAIEATPQLSSRPRSSLQHARDNSRLKWRSVPRDKSLLGEARSNLTQCLAAHRTRNLTDATATDTPAFVEQVPLQSAPAPAPPGCPCRNPTYAGAGDANDPRNWRVTWAADRR
jgi:hypothetical protein